MWTTTQHGEKERWTGLRAKQSDRRGNADISTITEQVGYGRAGLTPERNVSRSVDRSEIRTSLNIGNERVSPVGFDHTSTNAPDPIRTPQLSVLGRE